MFVMVSTTVQTLQTNSIAVPKTNSNVPQPKNVYSTNKLVMESKIAKMVQMKPFQIVKIITH